jgi:SNF2 family DNA or RNA helicase
VEALQKIRVSPEEAEKAAMPMPPGVMKFWTDDPNCQLRLYQIQMVWNLILCPNFLCGDSCGLGKTAIGAASMAAIKSAQSTVKFIVFTTSSAQEQWVHELAKFTKMKARCLSEIDDLPPRSRARPRRSERDQRRNDFCNFIGLDSERNQLKTPDSDDILVMRYSTLQADGEWQAKMIDFVRSLQKKHHLNASQICIIYDEATFFKGVSTLTHKNAKRLSRRANWVYGLTATAIKNNLLELFYILAGMNINVFGQEPFFKERYCVMKKEGKYYVHGKLKHNWVISGYKNLNEFMEIVQPYFWGRTVKEVGEHLPELNTETLELTMSPEQQKKTEDLWNGQYVVDHFQSDADFLKSVGIEFEEDIRVVSSKMAMLVYHQLVALNPCLLSDDILDLTNAPLSPKEEALVEHLNYQLEGEKVIVYTRFRREIERLKVILPGLTGRKVNFVHGNMTSTERYQNMSEFQTLPDHTLIIINQAAFEAVNLQQAAHMIAMDLPWSWGDVLQLIGRAVRLKSPHSVVNLIILQMKNSIDVHTAAVLRDKKGIFERVLTPSASLGIWDEGDHDFIPANSQGAFVNKLYDTLMLTRPKYRAPSSRSHSFKSFSESI